MAISEKSILKELRGLATKTTLEGMARYGIPEGNALGVAMKDMKKLAKQLGRNHDLAVDLWSTGIYEAQTMAVFIDEPERVTTRQMDSWAKDFNSWAICDTTCFHLFDKTAHAWTKVERWSNARKEFVKRGAFALIWALSVHDKSASDKQFLSALSLIEGSSADERPLIKKAIDMALRATGKRNKALNRAAIKTAERLAQSCDPSSVWIGKHALRELQSEKVLARL